MSNIVSCKSNPSLETLDKIATALNVGISELFSEKEAIYGIIILNGKTYRIDNFGAVTVFLKDCKDYLDSLE